MAARRYGRAHQRARAAGLRRLPPGTPCARCGHGMDPRRDRLDLDHAEDGTYLGFSHSSPCPVCGQRCNQAAGGRKSAERAGKRARERRCVICGTPFVAARGRTSAVQATCGAQDCVAALNSSRRGRREDPEPPATAGRVW